MTIEQRKQHLFTLKDFLRAIVLQIQQNNLCKFSGYKLCIGADISVMSLN
jgi:hypothetical protein